MKGVKIEYFTLCIALRKVIFFIYQKINSSDRVPLKVQQQQEQQAGAELSKAQVELELINGVVVDVRS